MESFFTNDIKKLNTLYNRIQFSFVFLYGRYGTGKTSLIREFCRDKTTVFFSAQETVPEQQLAAFHREVIRCLNLRETTPPFESWSQAFTDLSNYSFSHRVILVLDEFQHLTRSCPDFMEAFSYAIRNSFPTGKVFLIITSSLAGYAGQLIQDPPQEPFNAITAKAFQTTLPFYMCQPCFSGYDAKEQLFLYGITGGFSSHLTRLNTQLSAQQNVMELFFGSDSPLLISPLDTLHRELREISTYNFLLEIIAAGYEKLTDIAAKASIGTNKCAKYLGVLISLGLIRKEFPAAGESLKKVRYIFADHMMRFWYRFVYPNISGILFNRGREIFNRQVLPALDEYLLPIFEDVCAEYLERLADTGQTPFTYRHTGSWWTGGTKREPFFRIPLVAMDDNHTVLGICHSASSTPADINLLEKLLSPSIPFGDRTRYYCIFSMSGFTDDLRLAARSTQNVWLIDLEDIIV